MMKEQRRGAMDGMDGARSTKDADAARRSCLHRCGPSHRKARRLSLSSRARTARPLPAPRVPTTARSGLPFTVSCSRASRAPWFCRRSTFNVATTTTPAPWP